MSNAVTVLKQDIFSHRAQFESAMVEKSMHFEAEAGFAIQALQANDYLATVAMGNRQSLVNAVTNTAAIGVSLNPAKKQAYLVPRDKKVCLDISYIGLMDLATATGSILWGQAFIVREKDAFQLVGLDEKPIHTFNPFAKAEVRGPIVGVYVVIKTHHGDYLTHTMTIDQVYAIRSRSSAWKGGKTCPWHTDEEEMIRKTCVKQAYKYWPKNARLETAIHHLNTDGDEGIDFTAAPTTAAGFAAQPAPEDTEARRELINELESIAKTRDMTALADKFQAIGKPGRKLVGATDWERIKTLCEHGDVIEGEVVPS